MNILAQKRKVVFKKTFQIILILVAFSAIFLFSTSFSKVFSVNANVIINEFAAKTSGTNEDPDWVELYNSGNEAIVLDGWLIRDSTETNKVNLSGLI